MAVGNRRHLSDFHGGAGADQGGEADGVPVGEADAAGAAGAADGFGIGGAVEADAGLAEAAPEDADGAVRAGLDVEGLGVAAALAGGEELRVIAPVGEFDGVSNFPGAELDELGLAGGDRKRGDESSVGAGGGGDGGGGTGFSDDEGGGGGFKDADLVDLGVHHGVALAHGFVRLVTGSGEPLDGERLDVRHDDAVVRLEVVDFRAAVEGG